MGRYFWNLVIGEAVNLFGDAFGTMAMGLLVYDLTGSKVAMGSLLIATMIPDILIKLIGSPLVDRYSRSRLMVVMDLVQCLVYAIPPLLHLQNRLHLWHLYALSISAGLLRSLYIPARAALLPSLVAPERLLRANAILSSVMQGALMVAPTVAGVVVVMWGHYTALALDALSFGLCAITLLMIPIRLEGGAARDEGRVGYLAQAAAGFRFYHRAPALLMLLLVAAVCNMSYGAIAGMLIPFVKDVLSAGPAALGIVQTAGAAGFLIGSVVAGMMGQVRQRSTLICSITIVWGALQAGLSLVGRGQLLLLATGLMAIWMIIGINTVYISAIFQVMIPDHVRGRANAVRMLIAAGLNPVGVFMGSLVVERVGFTVLFIGAGLLCAAAASFGLFVPARRQLDGELHPIAVES